MWLVALVGVVAGCVVPQAAHMVLRQAYRRSCAWWWESWCAYRQFKAAQPDKEPRPQALGEEGALALWRTDALRAALGGALPRERVQALADVGMVVDPNEAVRCEADQEARCRFAPCGWQRVACAAAGAGCGAAIVLLGLPFVSALGLGVCAFALAIGVVCDMRARILPLESCGLVAVGGMLFQLGVGGLEGLMYGAVFAAITVAVCLGANRLFSRTGRVPVGWGDVRCMAALSLASGPFMPVGFTVCYAAAAAYSLGGIALRRLTVHDGVPMGPFLALWLVAVAVVCAS